MNSQGNSFDSAPGGVAAAGLDKKINLGRRELRVMIDVISGYPTGQSGASLPDVVRHCENQRAGYGLVDEEFLNDLHRDHAEIANLMDRLGETREEVSIVARTTDGGFTRMLLKRDGNGHYQEVKEGVDSSDKRKTHIEDNDLFILEKGLGGSK